MTKRICFCLLIFIGALTWSAVAASKLVGAKKSEFHLMFENDWPDPDPNINHYPHQTSCHYFYLVLSEEDVSIKKCPDGKLFDYFVHKCVEKESARCWSRRFSDIIHDHNHVHKVPKKFKCPYAYGKFPDITDCSRYYQCLAGKPKTKKCAPFEYFDKIKRKCIAEIKAVCADHTDVVEHGYKCPRSQGSFTFSKDCSKYYECIEKRPDLRTCPTHKLFDEKKRKCIPSEIVHCGVRSNPYEGKTTISVESTEGSTQEQKGAIIEDEKAIPEIVLSQTNNTDKPLFSPSNKVEISTIASTSGKKVLEEVKHIPPEIYDDSSENDISKEFEEPSEENHDLKGSKESSEEHQKDDLKGSKESSKEHHTDDMKGSKKSSEEHQKDDLKASKESSEEHHTDDMKGSKKSSEEHQKDDLKGSKKSSEEHHKDDLKGSKESSEDASKHNSKENSDEDNSKESTEERDANSSIDNEFITTAKITSSDENSTNQKTVSESNKLTSMEIHPTTMSDNTCHPKDLTCILVKNRVVRCSAKNGLFPHPKDERLFLHCSNFKIHQKTCPQNLIFQDSVKACVRPLNQAEKNP